MNRQEREKLKDQVMDMLLTGYSQIETAKILAITRRTIISYVKSRRDSVIEEMRHSAEEEMADLQLTKHKRTKRLWTIVLDPKSKPGEVAKAIQLLQNEEVLMIKRKQMVGLLPAEAPTVAIQNNNVVEGVTTVADTVKRVFPELIEKFSHNKTRKNESDR